MNQSREHSEHRTQDDQTHLPTSELDAVIARTSQRSMISWGAILAGLVFVIAMSWLLYLFGAAMGVSIADLSDGEAINRGFSIGAIIWIVLSSLVVYFLGAMLTARLSGKTDSLVGMLHGLTLWGLATTIILLLSYAGMKSLLQTGYSVVATTVSTVGSTVAEAPEGAVALEQTVEDLSNTRIATNIQARVKRRAAQVLARNEAPGGNASQQEIQTAINQLDSSALQDVSTHLVLGEMTAARETLADETNLTEGEVDAIVEGVANRFEDEIGTGDNNQSLQEDITNTLETRVADFVADLDAPGGAKLSQSDVRRALQNLTTDKLEAISVRLVQGDTQGAKDYLAANTNLTRAQINDVIDGVNRDVSSQVEQFQETANEMAEQATTYAQAVLWTVFLSGAMGLAVSLVGGWFGSESTRRLVLEVEGVAHRRTSTQ